MLCFCEKDCLYVKKETGKKTSAKKGQDKKRLTESIVKHYLKILLSSDFFSCSSANLMLLKSP